mmetsp:Transcript_28943/g.66988  ORF Transcript_28943/g.66988 Transcript_28943/m.66988 type:complete len:401 (-) Transcript_28943:3612-4814(-)
MRQGAHAREGLGRLDGDAVEAEDAHRLVQQGDPRSRRQGLEVRLVKRAVLSADLKRTKLLGLAWLHAGEAQPLEVVPRQQQFRQHVVDEGAVRLEEVAQHLHGAVFVLRHLLAVQVALAHHRPGHVLAREHFQHLNQRPALLGSKLAGDALDRSAQEVEVDPLVQHGHCLWAGQSVDLLKECFERFVVLYARGVPGLQLCRRLVVHEHGALGRHLGVDHSPLALEGQKGVDREHAVVRGAHNQHTEPLAVGVHEIDPGSEAHGLLGAEGDVHREALLCNADHVALRQRDAEWDPGGLGREGVGHFQVVVALIDDIQSGPSRDTEGHNRQNDFTAVEYEAREHTLPLELHSKVRVPLHLAVEVQVQLGGVRRRVLGTEGHVDRHRPARLELPHLHLHAEGA